MKKLAIILLAICCISLVACGRGQSINGHSMKTAFRSVKGLKKYMPAEKQMEFELSFWMLRDANKDDDTFLDIVDGKKPEEIIGLAKELYQERKTAGFKEYEQYATWEEMITKFGKERTEQDKLRKNKDDPTKPDDSILYNPRAPRRGS
jgi:hypothetical protein